MRRSVSLVASMISPVWYRRTLSAPLLKKFAKLIFKPYDSFRNRSLGFLRINLMYCKEMVMVKLRWCVISPKRVADILKCKLSSIARVNFVNQKTQTLSRQRDFGT